MVCEDCPFIFVCWAGILDRIRYCPQCDRINFELTSLASLTPSIPPEMSEKEPVQLDASYSCCVICFNCSERYFLHLGAPRREELTLQKDPVVPGNHITVCTCDFCKTPNKQALRDVFHILWLDLDKNMDLMRFFSIAPRRRKTKKGKKKGDD